jgi:RNA polymerase sigma-70 factor (ECF subfamily)
MTGVTSPLIAPRHDAAAPARESWRDGLATWPAEGDLDLVARRARAGDPRAAAALCAHCIPQVRRYFRRSLRDDHEAEDATQHVMLQLLASLPGYDERGTPFRAYLFRIAHNHALDRGATRARTVAVAPFELDRLKEAEDRGDAYEPGERRDSFDTLIATLPASQQRVLRLIYVHDLTPSQAGAVLGRSADDVRQMHKRARDRLRELVDTQAG